MLESIYIGLTGLNSYSRGLQSISNNVANLNTPGFKSSGLRFGDLFYTGSGSAGMLNSGPDAQFGAGVTYSQSLVNFKQGDLRSSDGDLDLAIQGRGLLVMLPGKDSAMKGRLYARTGQFGLDSDGFIAERSLGLRLGILTASGDLQALTVNSKRTNAPKATTEVKLIDNLSSTATEHTISGVEVYDANGGKQTWKLKFSRSATTAVGTWAVTVEDEKGAKVKEGEIAFSGSTPVAGKDKLSIELSPAGAGKSTITLNFSNVTGFSSGTLSSMRVETKDGYAAGNLSRVLLDTDGQIKIEYSNGQSEKVGHVALADFEDLQVLSQRGDSLFEVDENVQARIGRQGESGLGNVRGKSIEASNVDLSAEFGQLILYQRGYQASSQVVTVANEMIQQLFELRGRS